MLGAIIWPLCRSTGPRSSCAARVVRPLVSLRDVELRMPCFEPIRAVHSAPDAAWITSSSAPDAMPGSPQGTTMDAQEVAKFAALAREWWDPRGPFAGLKRLNAARVRFIRDALCRNFGREPGVYEPLHGLRVLDVGCGGGLLSEALARLGAHVHGVDAAPDSIAAAAAHARLDPGLNGRWAYRAATAEALVEQGLTFDGVVASEVIEHVSQPSDFAAALAALTAPGGALVLSTMNRTPEAYALAIVAAERLLRMVPRGTHEWERFVTPEELVMLFDSVPGAGVELRELAGMQYNPLRGTWALSQDTSVNYIAYFRKAGQDLGTTGQAA